MEIPVRMITQVREATSIKEITPTREEIPARRTTPIQRTHLTREITPVPVMVMMRKLETIVNQITAKMIVHPKKRSRNQSLHLNKDVARAIAEEIAEVIKNDN